MCFRYRPGVAQRVGKGIAPLFHDSGTRRGEQKGVPEIFLGGGGLQAAVA